MESVTIFQKLITIAESTLFANLIDSLGVAATALAVLIGGRKMSELLIDYKKRKQRAVHSYHANLKVYLIRLKNLVSDSQNNPQKNLCLLSANEKMRAHGAGNEEMAKRLRVLSEKLLGFLSSTPDQLPAGSEEKEEDAWYCHLESLIGYLIDFSAYGSGGFLPGLNKEKELHTYHEKFESVVDSILRLIETDKINSPANQK